MLNAYDKENIKHWYQREVKMITFEDDPDGMVFIAPLVYTKYHWTAKIARGFVGFYLRHWQWLLGTAIAIAGLYVAILSLK